MTNPFSHFVSLILGAFRSGRGESRDTGTATPIEVVRAAWPLDLQLLFIEPSAKDVERALDGWKWIGMDGLRPAAVSAFGDIFFVAADESVQILDMIEGCLTQASGTWSELTAQLKYADRRDELLLAGLVMAARSKSLVLGAGECYDFKIAPVLGGEMSVETMVKTFFVVKVHIAGQIHRQVKDLPPGAKINKVTISDR
jgi:hypothetical protein